MSTLRPLLILALLTLGLLVLCPVGLAAQGLHEVEGVGKIRTRGNPTEQDKRRGREEALRDAYQTAATPLLLTDVDKNVFRDRLKEMTPQDLADGIASEKLQREVIRRGTYHVYLLVSFKEGVIEDLTAPPDTENLERMRMRRIMIVIPEQHIGRPVPDPAAETEMINQFLQNGFRVVDQAKVAQIRDKDVVKATLEGGSNEELVRIGLSEGADYIIVGEAFSHALPPDDRLAGMVSCRARVEARMILTDTGEIVAADGREESASDMSELIAGKKALRNAGQELAESMLGNLMKRAEIEGDEEFITVIVGGTDFAGKERIKKLLTETPEVLEVREVEFTEGRTRLEVSTTAGAGMLSGLVYTAAISGGMVFEITEQTAFRITGRLAPQPLAQVIIDAGAAPPPQESTNPPRPPQNAGPLGDDALVDVSSQRWIALLIGIDDYSGSQGRIPNLRTPVDDIDALAAVLQKNYRFASVKIVRDKDASLRGLREAFDELGATLQKDDNVLIYYAGHGHVQKNTDVGLWVLADSKDSLDGLYNAEIKAYIAKMPARRVLLISDSCYSGDFLRRAVGMPEYEDLEIDMPESIQISAALAANPMPSREVITSGNMHPVPDEGEGYCKGHSPFACALVNALESAPARAALSTNDLFYHTHLFMAQETGGFAAGTGPQKGTLPEHRGGEFFLVRFE